jgi:hypothetical protein
MNRSGDLVFEIEVDANPKSVHAAVRGRQRMNAAVAPTKLSRHCEVTPNEKPGGGPEHTDDGHFIVINGRRWRATDPLIPPDVSQQLRTALMAARRAVGVALRTGDPAGERTARQEVNRLKIALGERGTPWWEQSEEERRTRWQV